MNRTETSPVALYPGSFDPPTNGHLGVLEASLLMAGSVVVAIGVHPGKTPLFTAEERSALLLRIVEARRDWAGRVRVTFFDDLVVSEGKRQGATLLIRGIRDGTDLDYEMQMAGMNAEIAPQIQTVFVPATPATRPITATLVRQIAKMGGDVAPFVPDLVAHALETKLGRR
ncbi:pantetheine-phosphate adenylyltransferase [Aureimonas pseudogalii]|uniref:pantetheine-phosphate adenylyltransferase n=1 Tax=Aureimonas pseudogalii TaxID=1744844 RepID=UPI001606CE4A|nr:pantetheine-phosphate adenylyltransferase [Aureimonas pseudogalii]